MPLGNQRHLSVQASAARSRSVKERSFAPRSEHIKPLLGLAFRSSVLRVHVGTVGTSIDLGESRADCALAMWDLQAGAAAASAESRAKPGLAGDRGGFEPL